MPKLRDLLGRDRADAPAPGGRPARNPEIVEGDRSRATATSPMDVPVPAQFGRYLVEYLSEHDFDIAHLNQLAPVVRRPGRRGATRRQTAS